MTTIVRKEIRKRGFFGKVFKYAFILFNLLMAFWFFSVIVSAGQHVSAETSQAGQAGAAIGATLGLGLIGVIWVAGDIILGLFVLLTRGNTIVIEEAA